MLVSLPCSTCTFASVALLLATLIAGTVLGSAGSGSHLVARYTCTLLAGSWDEDVSVILQVSTRDTRAAASPGA